MVESNAIPFNEHNEMKQNFFERANGMMAGAFYLW
jgi:hypothetical protein